MRERLLFHCHHGLGMGHLVRALSLAEALASRFEVVLAAGGPLPDVIAIPRGVDVRPLPPLLMNEDGALVAPDPTAPVAALIAERRRLLLSLFEETRPAVLMTDLFPFGRKKLRDELVPLLERAHAAAAPPVVISSVRDLLVTARPDQQKHDDTAADLAQRWFDAVLVHSDPGFARLEDSFRPQHPFTVPVLYTGFVARAEPPTLHPARRGVVVSSGGGRVGATLLACAVESHAAIWRRTGHEMIVVGGPFVPADEWRAIEAAARMTLNLQAVHVVPDLRPLLAAAAVSVSQCGYNTTMDLLQTSVRPLLVPFRTAREDEQSERARRLAASGAARVLSADDLTPARLAAEVERTLGWEPAAVRLDCSGASRTVEIVGELVAAHGRRIGAAS